MRRLLRNYIKVILLAGVVFQASCHETPHGNDGTMPDSAAMSHHEKNRKAIERLVNEVECMRNDSINIQTKLNLYTGKNLGVLEAEARKRGSLKKDEEAFIIKK